MPEKWLKQSSTRSRTIFSPTTSIIKRAKLLSCLELIKLDSSQEEDLEALADLEDPVDLVDLEALEVLVDQEDLDRLLNREEATLL